MPPIVYAVELFLGIVCLWHIGVQLNRIANILIDIRDKGGKPGG
jgi:hypothetical protein